MAVIRTIYPKSVAWNGITWDKANGGLLRVDFNHTSQPVEDRTGGDEYPVFMALTNKGLTVSVVLREFCLDQGGNMDCGTKSNMVFTMKTCDGTDSCTYATMVLVDISGTQPHGELGESTLSFLHLSADGSTDPVS